jgi:hypothetical protein
MPVNIHRPYFQTIVNENMSTLSDAPNAPSEIMLTMPHVLSDAECAAVREAARVPRFATSKQNIFF